MNRPSFRRHRNGLVQSGSGLAALVIALVLIALAAFRFSAPGLWYTVTAPVWHLGVFASSKVTGATTQSKTSLIAERNAYEEKVSGLTAENAALTAKVSDLTKLLGSRTAPAPGIVAAVLARPPIAPYDVLIIDQGTDAGIKLGDLVTGDGGTPLGTIGEADASESRVTLFSTHGIPTAGWAGDARIPVTLTGEGAGAFSASVLKDAGIKPGDGVYLANGGAFPVGTVVKVTSDPSSPTVSLNVRPYANPFSLAWVTVVPQ